MTASLDITTEQRKTLLALLRRFVPGVEVWAYGSRVKWKSHPASDLDIVVFTTPEQRRQFTDLKEALAEANLPFMVGVHVWAEEPERFQQIIREEHVVLQEAEVKQPRKEVIGWQTIRLGSACEKIGSGATPRGGSEVYQATGISLIRSQNIYNDGFKRDGLAFIGDKHARELENVNVQSGDVLLNITGDSVARVCQVPDEILPARVNQHVAIIRPKQGTLDARFLHYFLIHPQTQAHMLGLAGAGATRNALTKGMIESFEIKTPSFSEQRAIAAVLGALDDKIELNRRMNETLEALSQSLFKSWFVDATQSALPKGWRETVLSECCENIFSGGTPSTQAADYWGGDIPWLSSGETRSRFIIDTEKTITPLGVENSSTRPARAGSTVIASAGQGHTRGQTSLLTFDSYINQSVVVLVADKSISSDLFLFFDLARRYEQFRAMSDSQSSRGSLTTKLLAEMKVVVPPRALISKFDETVAPMTKKIIANLHESRTLAALRDTLLPKLLSGELRVAHQTRTE